MKRNQTLALPPCLCQVEVVVEEVELTAGNADPASDRLGFYHGFAASISVIIVSEIGDKTFFIAAILAMNHSR